MSLLISNSFSMDNKFILQYQSHKNGLVIWLIVCPKVQAWKDFLLPKTVALNNVRTKYQREMLYSQQLFVVRKRRRTVWYAACFSRDFRTTQEKNELRYSTRNIPSFFKPRLLPLNVYNPSKRSNDCCITLCKTSHYILKKTHVPHKTVRNILN